MDRKEWLAWIHESHDPDAARWRELGFDQIEKAEKHAERMRAAMDSDPERKSRLAQSVRAAWADPARGGRMLRALLEWNRSPAARAMHAEMARRIKLSLLGRMAQGKA